MGIKMTILNRYKARILKQLNITHEAWWDDWYDKTFDEEYFDKGPIDVWEEPALPKELGVKSPVWTELLTRGDDDMLPYRNIGGNSGVAEYDSGVDWFLIKFKDGSLYLYTHKSTLPERIYRMRQLAESGAGLNAYVNHMYHRHGIQYAGRNYKGNLTLTPGIESIGNHKGIRALQLIIAFQNTLKENNMSYTLGQEKFEELKNKSGKDGLEPVAQQALKIAESLLTLPQASNEGIWQNIKDFFVGRPTKIHLAGKDPDLRNKLKRTIGDPVWLSRQKYTLGEVNYRALPDFTPASASSYVQRYKSSLNSVTQHNDREMAKIKDVLQVATNAVTMYSSGMMTTTAPLDLAISRLNPYMMRLNINLKEPELMQTELVPQTGPALTKVEVRTFSDMIGTVHGAQTSYENSIRVNTSLINLPYVKTLYAPRPANPHMSHAPNPNHAPILAALNRLEQAYTSITYLLNMEIKQRVTTHAAWINAENIADSLVNYISKSITNVTTNSFENFDVSNEGIFDSLKKWFGGKDKEDVPGNLPVAAIDVAAKFTNSSVSSIPAITMAGPKTSIFIKNGSFNSNWIADLQKDVVAYAKDLQAAVTYDHTLEKWEHKWWEQLKEFAGNADRPEEFVALLTKMQKDEPKPWIEVFKPTHDYIIFGKGDLDDGEGGFERTASNLESKTVEINELSASQVTALKKLITNVANLIDKGVDAHYELNGHGPDFTDAPYRGYSDNKEAVEVMNKLKLHAHVNNDPFDHVHLITVRLELLLENLANYITLVNKHTS